MSDKPSAPSAVQNLLLGGAAAVFRLIPRRGALLAGGLLGRFAGALVRSKRRRTEINLEAAGSSDPKAAGRLASVELGRTLAEMLWTTTRSPEEVLENVDIEGLEAFREAAGPDGKRGVLMATSHTANWELVGLAASRAGMPIGVIAREMSAPGVEKRVIAFRDRCGIRTLMRGQQGASVAAARLLRKGGILGCMMDRISSGRLIVVPFLGRSTRLPLGPLELVARTGAAIVVGCAHRRDCGRTTVTFKRVETRPEDDANDLATTVARALEEQVSACPEQWLWIYRRQSRYK